MLLLNIFCLDQEVGVPDEKLLELHTHEVGLKIQMVSIPKRQKNAIFGVIHQHLGQVLHELARQKGRRLG
ncbi:hypothetical protein B0T40_12810 [Chromobacterium haemolyticum]|uniref:hypothetical protein n=1 Tax=Chromobacterium haemolyticum TaxID=394935 RepID=UPI0009DA75CE|nr:hypothetical protein [Chromobacterium haemolyticum]OQS35613.1 hypothetical protein B0T40_12810 [Chromobacterium haemolyticum]